MAHDEGVFSVILERIMAGQSLKQICEAEDTPARSTVHKWMADDPALSDRYARACEVRADHLFDEILHIADTPVSGIKIKTDGEGKVETTEGDMIEHRRLQVDARKWALARMQPKKYGDKIAIGGAGDLPPIQTEDVTAADILKKKLDEIAGRASSPAA